MTIAENIAEIEKDLHTLLVSAIAGRGTDRWTVSVHEAAHAVTALVLGRQVVSVEVNQDCRGLSAGWVRFKPESTEEGSACEAIVNGEVGRQALQTFRRRIAASDTRQALQRVLMLWALDADCGPMPRGRELRRIVRQWRKAAINLGAQHYHLIHAVADALFARGQLTQQAVLAIMRDAESAKRMEGEFRAHCGDVRGLLPYGLTIDLWAAIAGQSPLAEIGLTAASGSGAPPPHAISPRR